MSKVSPVIEGQGSTLSSRIRQRAVYWVQSTNLGSGSVRSGFRQTQSQDIKMQSKGSSASFTHWIHEEETKHEVEQSEQQQSILSLRHIVFTEEGQVDRERTVERSANSRYSNLNSGRSG